MKEIAVITDIHGNSSALRAVLSDIERNDQVKDIYCLGDLIAIGHETNQVLEEIYLRENIFCVVGNHDEAIINILNGVEPSSKGEEREHHYWIAKNMNKKFIPFLKSIPKKIESVINNKKFLFVHYHMNKNNKFLSIDINPSVEKLDNLYKTEDVDIVCFGHHHALHNFKGDKVYLNPGALGCNSKAIATYAIISIKDDGCVDLKINEVSYDNKQFLLNFDNYNVPARKTLLRIFYGNQDLKN